MSAMKRKRGGLWRALRSTYYWPAQALRHAARLASLPAEPWYQITAPWLPQRMRRSKPPSRQSRSAAWYHFRHQFTFAVEHVRFDLDRAVQAAEVKGLALIFFMGMGDYFFATPLISAIKKRFPDMPILACASTNGGSVNSPLLAELLRTNPDISEVRLYDGRQTRRYKNYDFRDALRQIPEGYLAMPVLYEHLKETSHRLTSLFETFGLALPEQCPIPLLHLPPAPAVHVVNLLTIIQRGCKELGLRGVIFLQLDSRSSHYTYPYTQALAEGFRAKGYFVLSASKLTKLDPGMLQLDFDEFAIMDSIHLLKLIGETFKEVYIVSVASVFWSVSAALKLPNLGMQHFKDDAMHTFWYDNIMVISHHALDKLPMERLIRATADAYELDERQQAVFLPQFILQSFDQMKADLVNGRL